MPVHNALPYLDEAVESILGQSYSDFEFVILDDASTDGSTERLRHWAAKDARIRLIRVDKNLGPALSSDRVAREAKAPIVARMDADDISHPDRLNAQVELLGADPQIGLVGSLADTIDRTSRKIRGPEGWRLTRQSWFVPFAHGTITYRREIFEKIGGYRQECEYWEDQDLVSRFAGVSKVLVIPRALYQVRQSTTSTRAVSSHDRVERAVDLAYRCIARLEQGRGYNDLLQAGTAKTEKLDPRVFIAVGSVALWSGGKPRLFRRLLRRGRLGFDMRTTSALIWTAWASANAWSLRGFLRMLLLTRNNLTPAVHPTETPVAWPPAGFHFVEKAEEKRESRPNKAAERKTNAA